MNNPTQRLMRSRNEKIIAGVAGGIAQYLAVDPVFVRLAFVALASTGVGLLVYPLLWVIMPQEQNISATPQPVVYVNYEEEIPINNVGSTPPPADPQARRNRLLGIILVSVGAVILANLIAPWMTSLLVPIIFLVAGVLLLRRGN